tara:strand:- start:108 stop:350 length:243 start_codon:yes stop_codon:yes gene_type:complete
MAAWPDQDPKSGPVVPALRRENSRDNNGSATQVGHLGVGWPGHMAMAILAVVVTAMNPETSDPLLQRCGVVQHGLEIKTF